MSFAGRAAQMAMVTFIGVTSGVYIFTPIVDNMKAQVPSRPPCPETPAAPPRPRTPPFPLRCDCVPPDGLASLGR